MQIAFHTQQEASVGEEALLRVTEGGQPKRKVSVLVEHCRPVEDGYLVVAESPDPVPELASQPLLGERCEERLPQRFRVMSADLPNFTALSIDCSMRGLQLETTGPLSQGQLLSLALGLDPAGEDVPCEASVVWCQPCGEQLYRAGLKLAYNLKLHCEMKRLLEERMGRAPEVKAEVPEPARVCVDRELPPPAAEEQAPLRAQITGYEMQGESACIHLVTEEGELRELFVPRVLSLKDLRGVAGQQAGFLACQKFGERVRIKFLTPWLEPILEFETDAALDLA